MTTIRVLIKKSGAVTVDVVGGQGAACSTLTKRLEDALGQPSQQTIKPEFYQEAVSQHDIIQS
jgi:hypothetical protein